jgi:catechol 2,3-dioxygenase-like lactoylglutathione lyase family enzyme
MKYKLHHFGIVSQDMDKSLAMYLDQLGQTLTSRWYNCEQLNIAFLGKGSRATLEIVGKPHLDYEQVHIAKHGYSINHLSFLVEDADHAFSELMREGVRVAWEPFSMDDILGMRQCAFYDDDGLLFELFSCPRGKTMSTPDTKTPPGPTELSLDHVSILTPDLRRAQRFYMEKLGLKPLMEYTEDDGGFIFLTDSTFDPHTNNFMLEIIGPPHLEPRELVLLEKHGACFDHLCFSAEDVHAAWKTLLEKGVQKIADPVYEYGLWMGWLKDPDGIEIEIMSPIPAEILTNTLQGGQVPNLAKTKWKQTSFV